MTQEIRNTPIDVSKPRPGDHIAPIRFRKRPVEIEAMRWSGHNLRQIIDFTGLHPSADKWTWEEYEAVVAKDGLKIFTLEGPLMAAAGDFIIKGLKGEFYPCKPDIFGMTYQPASVESEIGERHLAEDVLRCIPADWKPNMARDYGNLGPILAEYIDDLRALPSASREKSGDTDDAERWRFCMKHGFPRACFHSPSGKTYYYVRGFELAMPALLDLTTPLKAVDDAIDLDRRRQDG